MINSEFENSVPQDKKDATKAIQTSQTNEPSDASAADQQKSSAPKPVTVDSLKLDDSLDAEINAALGDASMMDLYELDDEKASQSAAQAAKRDSLDTSQRAAEGVVRGTVTSISGSDIFVDLGGKSQGLLQKDELDPDEELKEGQAIDVVIVRYDSRDGLVILSKKGADERLVWHDLEEGSVVEGRVTGHNKGGLELQIKGIKAFMPASQIDIYRVEDFQQYVGQKLVCEVTQVDRGDHNVVISRRNILEREAEKQKDKLWEELEKGQTRHGVVRSIMDYGAFVDLGGADGLLHVREMSWARVKDPKEILSEGQEIDVVVIDIDKDKKRIGLSLKQAGGDPWSCVEQNYPVGSKHSVSITNLMDFGAFAELEPGVEGLIPVSQMTWGGRVRHPSDVVQMGSLVEVEVMKIDSAKRKISLSMKKLQANPWDSIEERYLKDEIYKGKVARLTEFGAFISLEEGIDGLVHISELSDRRITKASEVVTEGQEVQVKVKGVIAKDRKISLTMKNLNVENFQQETSSPEAKSAPRKNAKRPRRGGLTW